ncbi:hypothetical protein L207DRAFT_523369 [Hyaloscypha variabilis F]|uniref:BZIP domain-containing protein n=1 Tax=Hyaloscypha variabilis (strain UAMH 11265 / GT02V1 / F) TaxID=1149755 RepID=A0A2J6S563_HYAVF|nr:hypothetical protein L207DRAFT_523369 [Hyaloscypha variabilis F]
MSSARERGTITPLKRGKRKITEARKEQNRIAQQVYRRRQKGRLSLGDKPRNGFLRKFHSLKPRQPRGAHSYSGDDLFFDAAQQTQLHSILEVAPYVNTAGPDTYGGFSGAGSDLPGSHAGPNVDNEGILSAPAILNHSFPDMDPTMLHNPSNYTEVISQVPGPVYHLIEDASPGKDLFTADSTSLGWDNDQHTSTLSSFEGSVDSMLIDFYYPHQELQSQPCGNLYGFPNLAPRSTDGNLLRIPGVDALASAVSNFLNSGQFRPSIRRFPLPDPYSNHLNCVQTAILLPYLHNARCIGLDIHDLIAMKSIFYRPNTTMADDPASLLLEARKPWIPAHLQPTLPQILFPHHPYLDLLPFPALRERAITFAAMFNAMDLKLDVFREGLACSPKSRNNEYLGNNQPWDIRSWEVKPWFLRKWRLLLDTGTVGGNVIDGGDDFGTITSII